MKSLTVKNTQNSEKKALDLSQNVRIHHHRLDKEFSIIANHGVQNGNLSWDTKGLLWYMLSRDSSFEIHTWHLASLYKGDKRGSGIKAIRRMLYELQEAGYLVYRKFKNKAGQWQHRYDIFPVPHSDFQKMFPHSLEGNTAEGNTAKGDVLPITELPITELNPPLSSPQNEPKKILKKKKGISLRSEEEEIPIYKILESTILNAKERNRLSKEYSEEEVSRALTIAKTQPIKKSFMGLLLNILKNPQDWPDPEEAAKQTQTPQQQLALEYNEKLRNSKRIAYERSIRPGEKERKTVPPRILAVQNDTTILENNSMQIILNGEITGVSLKSSDFTEDIKHAIKQLR